MIWPLTNEVAVKNELTVHGALTVMPEHRECFVVDAEPPSVMTAYQSKDYAEHVKT